MVGHSFGGFNVRVFTSLYPADVAGVVLAEGSHEDEDRPTHDAIATRFSH